ncbi:DegT/DnrJ/EryC1/StrS aminotransferase family protein [Pontibacter sp. SGAir0037]|uniref:DegT/DnrJ/EryC1/StrS family aminotransferase n=1 Tax=Pontibacter sp. SGAir0037 TaxID=2571030 RepID=UPI0010CCC352|nr:DegT/DnrJ/EryC1/StrS family aminotransferase [Pontibacter sp. SGAir0037]QCR23325.1 DegT/DnrJ/EryC1/StrS family aminotransferase [Pontibacter sp. SGAir0037]
MAAGKVPFFEFRDWPAGIEGSVTNALLQVLDEKQYILGGAVADFEQAFAKVIGAGFAVGVGNGYDALVVALKAMGIQPGDEVILPANTFIATANAVVQAGAIPVFAEPAIDTYNLTAAGAAPWVTSKTKAIVPVHLYGQTCAMESLLNLAKEANVQVLEDAAQAHGARYKQQYAGAIGHAGAFSFYPTKNLGAIGDGGAVVTSEPGLANFMRMYRNYGGLKKYRHELVGINTRLDTLQAAVLEVKLKYLKLLNRERQRLAAVYLQELSNTGDLVLPFTEQDCEHVYHIFCIRTKHRDALQAWLQQLGVQTATHYPVPVHLQQAYRQFGYKPGSLPVAEELAATCLSLPLFPGMREAEQEAVIAGIKHYFNQQR